MGLGYKKLENGINKFRCVNGTKNAQEMMRSIRIHDAYTARILDEVWEEDGSWDALYKRKAKSGLDEVSLAHFQAAACYRQSNFLAAYNHQLTSYNAFLRVFLEMTRWGVHTLFAISKDLSEIALRADMQLRAAGAPTGKMEEATRAINQGFSMCMTDREPVLNQSRKWGTYHMANLLFGLYLRLHAYNLCVSMIRAIRASELPPLEAFPMSDQVTFRFYRGMLSFRSEKYHAAKEDLLFALEHCHRSAYSNKTRILIYLAPMLMMEGRMPHSRILRRYPVIKALYGDIAQAAKAGNIGRFAALMAEKEQQLMDLGVFLAVEHVHKIAVRQLLYKVYLIDGKPSRISFERFAQGFTAAGLPMDVAGVECVLVDMVFVGYIKGYLAHEHGMAVLSKQVPFPPITSCPAPTSLSNGI
ncbi:COP9 signalosome (CSN) subunit [Kickxella alabastrina]|uniref:COP9 signalosome (CSN) subunit n=1 Tax=Kickxella alabastrina TaxID=61397 RepID=A0ACC1ITK2_9FUNG|nr:COP9 signalosome (CSN) subunit [Kickxella alabastrina]